MSLAGNSPAFYSSQVCAPLSRFSAATTSIWVGFVFLQIRRESTHSLLNARSLDGNHSAEQALRTLGSTPSKMALSALGPDQLSGPGQSESFGSGLVGFEFVFLYFALLCHPNFPHCLS